MTQKFVKQLRTMRNRNLPGSIVSKTELVINTNDVKGTRVNLQLSQTKKGKKTLFDVKDARALFNSFCLLTFRNQSKSSTHPKNFVL